MKTIITAFLLPSTRGAREETQMDRFYKHDTAFDAARGSDTNRPSSFRGSLRISIAQVLVFALLAASLPARAQVTISCSGLSGQALINCKLLQQLGANTNNGNSSSRSGNVAILAGVAGAAVAGVLILYLVKKRHSQAKRDPPVSQKAPNRFAPVAGR